MRDLKNFDIREVVAQAALGLFKSFSVEMLQRSMVTTEGQLIVPADLAARYMRLSRIHWDEIDEDERDLAYAMADGILKALAVLDTLEE